MSEEGSQTISSPLITWRGLRPDLAIAMANGAAQTVAFFGGMGVPEAWLVGGRDENNVGVFKPAELDQIADNVMALGEFVRANPLAPTEALFIFAAGRGFHRFPSTSFADQPFWLRQCYRVFRDNIVSLDEAIAKEQALAAAAQAQAAPPPLAAALLADPRDTVLELQPDPLEVRSDAILAPLPVVPPTDNPVPAPADDAPPFEPAPDPLPTDPAPETASGTVADPVEDPAKPRKRRA